MSSEQNFKIVVIDGQDESFLVCYTDMVSGSKRITSVVKTTVVQDEFVCERIYRTEEPKLWSEIKALL